MNVLRVLIVIELLQSQSICTLLQSLFSVYGLVKRWAVLNMTMTQFKWKYIESTNLWWLIHIVFSYSYHTTRCHLSSINDMTYQTKKGKLYTVTRLEFGLEQSLIKNAKTLTVPMNKKISNQITLIYFLYVHRLDH